MNETDSSSPVPSLWANIIYAVRTPLGFFALVALSIEAIFAILASQADPPESTYLIFGMTGVFILLLLLVAILAVWRPEALSGLRPLKDAPIDESPEPAKSVEKIAEGASVRPELIDPKLVRFIPPLPPTQFKIINLPRGSPIGIFKWPFSPTGKLVLYGIPFFLVPILDSADVMRGHLVIDIHPDEQNRPEAVKVEVSAEDVSFVHILISAGHGYRIHKEIQFLHRRVGYVRFEFADGTEQRTDLVLGQHLREWAFGNSPKLVTEIDLSWTKPAWLSHNSTRRFDLLTIPLGDAPRDLEAIEFVAQFEDDHPGKNVQTPSIIVSGITLGRAVSED